MKTILASQLSDLLELGANLDCEKPDFFPEELKKGRRE